MLPVLKYKHLKYKSTAPGGDSYILYVYFADRTYDTPVHGLYFHVPREGSSEAQETPDKIHLAKSICRYKDMTCDHHEGRALARSRPRAPTHAATAAAHTLTRPFRKYMKLMLLLVSMMSVLTSHGIVLLTQSQAKEDSWGPRGSTHSSVSVPAMCVIAPIRDSLHAAGEAEHSRSLKAAFCATHERRTSEAFNTRQAAARAGGKPRLKRAAMHASPPESGRRLLAQSRPGMHA